MISHGKTFLLLLSVFTLLYSCNTNENSIEVFNDVRGTLIWGYPPEVDGVGMIFETDDQTYGLPGTKDDYQQYFDKDENSRLIEADYMLTGNETIRGWGTTYKEIKLISARKL